MRVRGIVRSEPDLTSSLAALRERLAETIAWCQRGNRSGDPAAALRSRELVPPPALPWPETLRTVGDARLAQLGRSWRRTPDPLAGGRLVVYFPTPPHSRGGAQLASQGYFDHRDAPPWDTWVAYIEEEARSYLVSWVPPDTVSMVASALKVSRTSLDWLDDPDLLLGERLTAGQAG